MKNRIKQIKIETIGANYRFSFFDEKNEIIMQNDLSDEEKTLFVGLMRRSADYFEYIWNKQNKSSS